MGFDQQKRRGGVDLVRRAGSVDRGLVVVSPGKNSWPELVGALGEDAVATIKRENSSIDFPIILLDGTPVIHDRLCNRVWVWVNTSGIVVRVPTVG
ncbi:hypothetical protein Q3G72_017881 [Acer saccharum]|nr:hypothetical protein Q3G72_017881 [Acer saccharum]